MSVPACTRGDAYKAARRIYQIATKFRRPGWDCTYAAAALLWTVRKQYWRERKRTRSRETGTGGLR